MMIAAQGLDCVRPAQSPADVLQCIERMALLQIDTIHVVNRSPYWVLWSRLGQYPMPWLDQLLADGDLCECWAHEACFAPRSWLPMQYRLIADRVHTTKTRWAQQLIDTHPDAADAMVALVRARGQVRSSDFKRGDGKRGTWWAWSHEKSLLEALFAVGKLTVSHRERFQRVYTVADVKYPELREVALPEFIDVQRAQIRATARALGVVHERWLGDYFRMKRRLHAQIEYLVQSGELIPVRVEGLAGQAWLWAEYASWMTDAPVCTHTTLLMPFDPLVWDRLRARDVFDFDYKIECYTPAAKRQYGYFTLPVLYRDRLVGRFDCKAHRKQGIFEIIHAHFESDVVPDAGMYVDIAAAIRDCAQWHGTPEVQIRAVSSADHARGLGQALA